MGYFDLPDIEDYWNTDKIIEILSIRKLFTKDRFLQQEKHLWHYDVDTQPQDKSERLYKIKPFIEYQQFKFSDQYLPTQKLSVNESMIGFNGRNKMK